MSPIDDSPRDGWSVETLKAYVDLLFEEREKYLNTLAAERDNMYVHRLRALEEAVKDISVLKQSVQTARDAILAQERHVAIVQAASQTAINKAEHAQELRNQVSNEFRAQLADQAATLMPRSESVTARIALQERLEEVISSLRNELNAKIDAVEKRADEERSRADRGEGRTLGMGAAVGFIVATIAVVGTIFGIVVSLR